MTENYIGIFDLNETLQFKISYFDIKHVLHQHEKSTKGKIIILLDNNKTHGNNT
jgi:hypothetical protein